MSTIGVLGGGQLGRMLALAGYPLGLEFVLLDPTPQAPAGRLAEVLPAPFTDASALDALASRSRLATYEFENVPLAAVRRIAERIDVFPPPRALEVAQDRLSEKTLFRSLGIPTAPFAACESLDEVEGALAEIGAPAILKTRREGYDGKGQALVLRPADAAVAHAALSGGPLLLEGFVKFERELSILAVRSRSGAIAFWPLVENVHREGILRLSLAPAAPLSAQLQARAEEHARRVLETLDYVGVLAIEFFERAGELLANEMAPRVHNSGHWTIEGAVTSQFENHLRALLGWPLGETSVVGASAMINLIATVPPLEPLLEVPGAHLHLYGKSPRPGRKLGHVTIVAPDATALAVNLARVAAVVDEPALRR